jgi:Family of unknown function (DUF6459)
MTMPALPVPLDGLDPEPVLGQQTRTHQFPVRPAPRREPPFDDEQPGRHLSVVGPLDQPLPFTELEELTPSAMGLQPRSDPFAIPPTGPHELPEPTLLARRLVIGVIETVTGRRSVSQLRPHTSPTVQAGLARDAGRISRLGTARRPAALHSLHVTEPADGVAEVAAVLQVGDCFRALALRLEGSDGRWRCVRLQIG